VPIYIDLVNIFISKTQFYSTWQTPFTRVQKFPQMMEWLENEEHCPLDSDIWAEEKHPDDYSLADLTSWMNRKEVVKGKGPAVAARSRGKKLEKRKKERKARVSSSEESSPEERKKSKSKSKKKLSE
jgi:hypothetical protein